MSWYSVFIVLMHSPIVMVWNMCWAKWPDMWVVMVRNVFVSHCLVVITSFSKTFVNIWVPCFDHRYLRKGSEMIDGIFGHRSLFMFPRLVWSPIAIPNIRKWSCHYTVFKLPILHAQTGYWCFFSAHRYTRSSWKYSHLRPLWSV